MSKEIGLQPLSKAHREKLRYSFNGEHQIVLVDKHSIALCEQVTALDYGRIIENMGKVEKYN